MVVSVLFSFLLKGRTIGRKQQFSKEQLEAIRHEKGPMLVLAGPGSGKTTVITHRVKYMLEHGRVNGSQILVITFTKAAAGEMKSRFEK